MINLQNIPGPTQLFCEFFNQIYSVNDSAVDTFIMYIQNAIRMKKYLFYLLMLLTSGILTGCLKEEEEYYSSLGIIHITDDSTIIHTDDGERLLVDNDNTLGSGINDNDRIIADFTLVDGTTPSGIDYIIHVYYIEKVLFKPVIELTSEIQDSIGNDELGILSMWLEKDFLNLNFMFYGGNVKHFINLIRYPGEIPSDTIDLEIRHNNRNDDAYYRQNGFVTFDLQSLKNGAAVSVVLCIKARDFDDSNYRKYFTYRY